MKGRNDAIIMQASCVFLAAYNNDDADGYQFWHKLLKKNPVNTIGCGHSAAKRAFTLYKSVQNQICNY